MSYSTTNATPSASTTNANYLLEQEKFARDLYLSLGKKWDLTPFVHIPISEQSHIDTMQRLIASYTHENPVLNEEIGVFENPELQAKYDKLLAQGLTSPQQALWVGGLAEETDISDLKAEQANTQDPETQAIYQGLIDESHNHLRAFARHLKMYGIDYQAQLLPEAEVQSILTSPMTGAMHAQLSGSSEPAQVSNQWAQTSALNPNQNPKSPQSQRAQSMEVEFGQRGKRAGRGHSYYQWGQLRGMVMLGMMRGRWA